MDLFDGIPQMGMRQVWLSLDGEEGCGREKGDLKKLVSSAITYGQRREADDPRTTDAPV